MFNSVLGTTLTAMNFFICIGTAFVLGLVIGFIHMLCARTNKNFVITLAILPMLVTLVILLVNGNLGTSVAIVGAFSLVRFRSIPGNSREIMFVFFAMAIGLATGTGYIAFAALFTVIVGLLTLILTKLNFGDVSSRDKILTILIPEELDYTSLFDEEFKEFLSSHKLVKAKTTNMGSMFELTYQVTIKDGANEKQFIDKLRIKNGNLKIALSHPLLEEEL
jgi:uncharacterized membrane protein YhiD involved in acid resistance